MNCHRSNVDDRTTAILAENRPEGADWKECLHNHQYDCCRHGQVEEAFYHLKFERTLADQLVATRQRLRVLVLKGYKRETIQ